MSAQELSLPMWQYRNAWMLSMKETMILVRRIVKIALLLFGLLPFILFICSVIILEPGEKTKDLFFTILFVLTAISIPGAFVCYVVHVHRNKCLVRDQRNLWIALLFFGNICVYPFYWYLHIWRERKEDRTVGSNTRPC